MKAIILAAGRGSRMMHLTKTTPKCLLKVKGKSLIEWQLDAIRGAGIEEIAIVTGYRKEMLRKYKLVEFYNHNWSKTQMVYSLFSAREWLMDKDFIISYSDIFYQQSAIDLLKRNYDDISITYDPNWRKLWENRFEDPLSDAESFQLDKDNNLVEIGNAVDSINDIQGQYMGLLKISNKAMVHFEELFNLQEDSKKENLDMTGLLQLVLKDSKFKIHAYPYSQIWGEVDNKNDLEFYNL